MEVSWPLGNSEISSSRACLTSPASPFLSENTQYCKNSYNLRKYHKPRKAFITL